MKNAQVPFRLHGFLMKLKLNVIWIYCVKHGHFKFATQNQKTTQLYEAVIKYILLGVNYI